MSKPLQIIAISGSLRQHSTNTGLLRSAQKLAPADMHINIADISAVPFYNADLAAAGKPPAVERVVQQIGAADALLLACPEYNYSIAPALKNVLDWASREPDNSVLNGKAVAIMGAGGGMGTSRAQYHLRQVCVFLNLHPLNKPEVFANAFKGSFDEAGNLTDPKIMQLIKDQLQALGTWALKLRP